MINEKGINWRKNHLKNLIWSANKAGSLYNKKDIPRFKKELEELEELEGRLKE